jgi:hypothetical protein
MAWSIMTYFVVLVIVIEQKGPVGAIERSMAVMKRTWGESLTAHFGVGLISFLLSLTGIVPIVGGVIALSNQMVVVGIALILMGLLIILSVAVVISALSSIILAALYVYAAEGVVPQHYNSTVLQQAFGPKG